jgi:acyl carrier protein
MRFVKGGAVPQTQSEIRATIREILTELFPDHDITRVGDGDSLEDSLDIDSMAVIDVALEVERRLGVHVPDEGLEHLTSIDAITTYLTGLDKR